MSAQVQFAYPITYISVHSHLDTHTHTHSTPSVSFWCCDLSGDLHVQIMFVFCFANQMIDNCLWLHALKTHTCVSILVGRRKRSVPRVFKADGERDRDRKFGCVLQKSWTDNQSCWFVTSPGWQKRHIGHDVVRIVECCFVSRSHLYHYHDPPPHQPPSGTFMSGLQNAFYTWI